ncbi:MAG: cell envelope integrity protein TolA [Thermodesulfobacteriota bacterium]|nr:cell envelope integrity protein TolA [Thermodesulfobacteriota bacterium]
MSKMLIPSLLFHLAILSTVLFVPESIPSRRTKGVIYEVDLVEMPDRNRLNLRNGAEMKRGQKLARSKNTVPSKRISEPKKKEEPIAISKRAVKRTKKPKRPKASHSELLDQALERIEKRVKAEDKDPVDHTISKLETRVKKSAGDEFTGSQADSGITMRIYRMEVEDRIKSNWSYPAVSGSFRHQKDFEAVILIEVKDNGAILKAWFKKRSSNIVFDQSVLKAVERSDPLPPFPEGYRRTHDEIEINFNLSDLEGH